jgi:hypothetical protein
MLKIYNIINYVSIDGAKWREVGSDTIASEEELETKLMMENLSFNEAREYLSNNHLDGIKNDNTFFRKRPTIKVNYYDAWDPVEYRYFNTISYKTTVKEWTNVTLEWIIKWLPADQCIQYLKERGITACPILK